MKKYYIGYRLHKDSSPTVIECETIKEKTRIIKNIKLDGYEPIVMTKEQADSFLDWYKPIERKKTREEMWFDWALGKV